MSKLISGDGLVSCQRWDAPAVEAAAGRGTGRNLMTAVQLEKIQKQAYAEAFARGQKEGYAAGQSQVQAAARRLEELLGVLAEPLKQLDDQVEQELGTLALVIARHMVRREISTDPAQVIGVVREALSSLPLAARNARIHLHPEDVQFVRSVLSSSENERGYQLVDDPSITRGGCRVITDASQIDATLEKRLAAVAASLLGGERHNDTAAE